MSDGEWAREVPCKDFRGRDRALRVSVTSDHEVVVTAPPGESGRLSLRMVNEFRDLLLEAQQEAVTRRQGGQS